jgi:predicted esterase YcpF (UPF0227 family)
MTKIITNNGYQLYYIHGYESEPLSKKGKLFRQTLNAKPIKYRDCPPQDMIISQCLKEIRDKIKKDSNPILIGSSFGGFLAAKIAQINPKVKQIILLNPAIIPPFYKIDNTSSMPHRILIEMKDTKLFYENIPANISIICGTNDDVIPTNWTIDFAITQQATIKFLDDDHRFTLNLNNLPRIIKNLIDKT